MFLVDSACFVHEVLREWGRLFHTLELNRAYFLQESIYRMITEGHGDAQDKVISDVVAVLRVAHGLIGHAADRQAIRLPHDDRVEQELADVRNGRAGPLRMSPGLTSASWSTVGAVPAMYAPEAMSREPFDTEQYSALFRANEYLATYLAAWPASHLEVVKQLQQRSWSGTDVEADWTQMALAWDEVLGASNRTSMSGVYRDLRATCTMPTIKADDAGLEESVVRWLRDNAPVMLDGKKGIAAEIACIGRRYPQAASPEVGGRWEGWQRRWAALATYAFVGAYEGPIPAHLGSADAEGARWREGRIVIEPTRDVFLGLRSIYLRLDRVGSILLTGTGFARSAHASIELLDDVLELERQQALGVARDRVREKRVRTGLLGRFVSEEQVRCSQRSAAWGDVRRSECHAVGVTLVIDGQDTQAMGISVFVEQKGKDGLWSGPAWAPDPFK